MLNKLFGKKCKVCRQRKKAKTFEEVNGVLACQDCASNPDKKVSTRFHGEVSVDEKTRLMKEAQDQINELLGGGS